MKSSVIDMQVWQDWREFEKNEDAPNFFCELLEKALVISPPKMAEMFKAAAVNDYKLVSHNAHSMASTFMSLGASSLAAKLKELENATRSQTPVINSDLVKSIEQMYPIVMSELQAEYDRLKHAA